MKDSAATPSAPSRQGRGLGVGLALIVAMATLLAGSASAQVSVTATAGDPGPTNYTTLGNAFAAINAGVPQGVITVSLVGDTDETTVSAVLNASGTGGASYTSVLVAPSGGVARTVTGATTAGNPLVDLNGADNVTIDGLNSGGNSLTIQNTTVSATSGTSTIRFQADATGNTVTNASILGSSTMATTTNGGNIWFGAGAVTTGNDNNTVSNCNIGPAGANLPAKAIYGNGSTGTTAQFNSGVTINNNNIFDYFSATVQSNGMYLSNGNTDWIVTNNRFFQTATRTQTTGNIHAAIQIAGGTGNNNHNISGNTIGFASAAGTGTYSFVGVNASSKLLGIYFSAAGTTAASSIQGNTVTAINVSGVVGGTSTTGAFLGISIASGLTNIGTVSGNTVGSLSAPGAITVSTNNAAGTEMFGIYFFPSALANVSNNVVGGMTMSNSGAGSLVYYGIRAFTTGGVFNTMLNNTVGSAAAPITNTSASTASRTIGLYCQSGVCIVTGNSVGNLSMNAGNVGTGAAASMIGIWIDDTGATLGNNVAQNTVRSLSNTSAAAAVTVTGLHYNGATTGTHLVQRNLVHSISTTSTSATAVVNGINIQAGATAFQNNMIAVGSDMTANSPQINGINETLAGTDSIFHNSVFVGGSSVAAGTASSFAFQSSIVTVTRNYRDNIFFNGRSNLAATSKHYAIRVGGTAPSPAGLNSNNNVLLANGTGGLTGLFNAVDQPTLAAWQAATAQDSSSLALDPQYLAPTAVPPDLHINPAVLTPIEGNGFPIATVTDDFDGQARAGLTPTDIGADAGNFIGTDLLGPVISYAPFVNTSLTTNRTLTATLSDLSGVATGSLAPRVYYRNGAGPYFSQGCALTSGTVNNGTWDCVINNADMGGVVTGDVVSYFVIAQDTLGNIGSNPGGVAATDVNNVTSPPPTPNSYSIVPGFSGTLPVGAGQTFTSLTNAGGVFAAINAGALTGNVVISVTSDLAGELGTNALNQWGEDGVGNYTFTIMPTGGAWTISGDSTTAPQRSLIRLNGADRFTMDGSTSGGTDRSLTVTNADVSTASAVILVSSGAAGAQNDTFKNLVVIGSSNIQTFLGIGFGGATVASLGTDNDNNRVENCDLRRMQFGIASQGASNANKDTGTIITRNVLNSTGADSIGKGAIIASFENGIQITENTVGNIISTTSNDVFGISLGGLIGWANTTVTGGSEVSNATVSRNNIGIVRQTNTFSAAGIIVTPATTGTNLISNNFISGVLANGTAPDFGAGIFVIDSGVDSTTRVYANSVSMTGTLTGANQPQYALAVNGTDPLIDVQDNILVNTQSTGTINSYAVGLGYSTFANLTSDFNDLLVTVAANFMIGRTVNIGPAGGTDQLDLAAWQAATGKDAASESVDPLFVSTTDLHLAPPSPEIAQGVALAGVTNDFDNEPRSVTAPDVGADEVVPWTVDLSITKTHAGAPAPGESVVYTITATNPGPKGAPNTTIADTFDPVLTCSWTASGTGGASGFTPAGAGNINDTAVSLPGGSTVTYTATCLIPASATGTIANTATVTGSATIVDPVPTNNSATDILVLGAAADLAITKTDGVTTAVPGGSVTYTITASNAGPSNAPGSTVADTFPASLTCSWTCVGAGGGTCTAAGAGNINDSSVNLPAGGSVTYTASCSIAASATGTLSNTATVMLPASVGDPVPGNNSATDTDTLGAVADAGITKTDGVTTAVPGGSVTYTITASNAGPSNAPGSTVADTFPASLTCSWTCVGAGGGTCTAAGAGNINDSVNLPAGGSVTYSASCTIASSATGNLSNTATVATSGSVSDPVPGNNAATDTDSLAPSADLGITKDDGATTAIAGTSVTYTIVATNPGPSDAPASSVADTFPSILTCTWTCAGSGGGTCTAAGAGNINDTANLPAGASATYTASCAIASSATGTLSNTATTAPAAGVTDPVPGNNSATDADTLLIVGDLVVTKDDGVTTAVPGGSVTYTIAASNAGPSDMTLGTVNDAFPPEETCTWTCAGSGGGTCSASGVGNISDPVTLPVGGLATYTAQCTIDPFATNSVSNSAAIDAPGFTDPNPNNNQATDNDVLARVADLSISKDDGVVSVPPGGNATYSIGVSNLGPSYVQGNTVTDVFPSALTCSWTCTPDGSGGTTCNAGPVSGDINDTPEIAPGHSVAYTATCAVSGAATGSISNTATVAVEPGASDPDPSNDSATDVDAVAQSVSIADVTATEGNSGNTPADFVVTLDAPSAVPVSVDFTTVDGTATVADNDYLPFSGTLIFNPGETSKILSGSVVGDVKVEGNETFTVVLSNPVNAVLLDDTGLGTILNDDVAATLTSDELVHDSRETRSLGLLAGIASPTYFRIMERAHTSYEVLVDAVTGDIAGSSGPQLDRLASDATTVLQSSASATGGSSRSLRFENATGVDVGDQYIRVQSAGCDSTCDPSDSYRIRAYDTSYRMSRFNNSATQVTLVVIANPTDQVVTGNMWFWGTDGTLLATQALSLQPKATLVLNTLGIPGLAGQSGSVTVSADAPFGSLTGKAVAVEPATGFTFDTPMSPRAATTKMVPRDN